MIGFKNIYQIKSYSPLLVLSRNGHRIRGKPPGVAKTIVQRLESEFPVDEEIEQQINIGFPALRKSRSAQLKERLAHIKARRTDSDLEKLARSGELLIDLKQVNLDSQSTDAGHHLKLIAEHYGIFRDLFKDAYFVPRVPLDIKYESEDSSIPVYNGNIIQPSEASSAPSICFDGEHDPITKEKCSETSYWTLVATNPDCHLGGGEQEYLHWFVSNIPNGNVSSGEVIAPYIQPFPANGLGYQRVVFIIYKQNFKMDFSKLKKSAEDNREERLFSTRNFYKQFQEDITPAGLSFFQTSWDNSLTDFFHNVLKIKEPTFAYNHPSPYRADQKWFALKQPFNLYMDKYRDEKEINKDYLEKKLAKTHPFDGPEAPLRFPNAHYYDKNTPSWLQFEMKKERLGVGRIAKFEENYS